MKCPETMVFDAGSSACIKDDTDTPPWDPYTPNCARATNGAFFPSYTDCSKFWLCFFQYPISFQCGEGTWWSQEYLTCVWPEDARCVQAKYGKESQIK